MSEERPDLSALQSRAELTAALREGVQSLIERTDAAAEETLRRAQADAGRLVEEAYERYSELATSRARRLSQLSDALVAEAAALAERASALSVAIDHSIAQFRSELGLGDGAGRLYVDVPPALAERGGDPSDSGTTADESAAELSLPGSSSEEGHGRPAGILDLFRWETRGAESARPVARHGLRWSTPLEESITAAPEEVRVLIAQMRQAGEPESAVVSLLEEWGIVPR